MAFGDDEWTLPRARFRARETTLVTRRHVAINQRRHAMRAVDCVHPAHEDVHATAATDDELVEQVRQHITQVHPDMSPDDATEIVAQGAYDE